MTVLRVFLGLMIVGAVVQVNWGVVGFFVGCLVMTWLWPRIRQVFTT